MTPSRGTIRTTSSTGGQGDDCVGQDCTVGDSEAGNDFLKTKDNVSGNDIGDGGSNFGAALCSTRGLIGSCQLDGCSFKLHGEVLNGSGGQEQQQGNNR